MRAFVTVAHTAFAGAVQIAASGYHCGPQLMHVPKHAVRLRLESAVMEQGKSAYKNQQVEAMRRQNERTKRSHRAT